MNCRGCRQRFLPLPDFPRKIEGVSVGRVCHMLPCITMYYHVLPCIAMYCHVLPCIVMYFHVLHVLTCIACIAIYYSTIMSFYHIRSREGAKYEAVIHCSVLV